MTTDPSPRETGVRELVKWLRDRAHIHAGLLSYYRERGMDEPIISSVRLTDAADLIEKAYL